jgi:hypothetical protein
MEEKDIKKLYQEETQGVLSFYGRNGFFGFSLSKVLELTRAIKHSKENINP